MKLDDATLERIGCVVVGILAAIGGLVMWALSMPWEQQLP